MWGMVRKEPMKMLQGNWTFFDLFLIEAIAYLIIYIPATSVV